MHRNRILWIIFWLALFLTIGILLMDVILPNTDVQSFRNTQGFLYLYFAIYLTAIISLYGLFRSYAKNIKYNKSLQIVRLLGACFAIAGIVFIVSLLIAIIAAGDRGVDFIVSNFPLILIVGLLSGLPIAIKWLKP